VASYGGSLLRASGVDVEKVVPDSLYGTSTAATANPKETGNQISYFYYTSEAGALRPNPATAAAQVHAPNTGLGVWGEFPLNFKIPLHQKYYTALLDAAFAFGLRGQKRGGYCAVRSLSTHDSPVPGLKSPKSKISIPYKNGP
jgi:hypothetical protein